MAGNNDTTTLRQLVGRLMARTPMLRLSLAVVVGILLAEYLPLPKGVWVVATVVSGLLLVRVAIGGREPIRKRCFLLLLWLAWIGIGALLPLIHAPANPFPEGAEGRDCRFYVRLVDTPHPTPKCYKVVAEVLTVEGRPATGRVLLYIRQDQASAQLRYGDRLWAIGRPQHPQNRVGDASFDYRRYLRHKGIVWQCYLSPERWQWDSHDGRVTLLGWSKGVQFHLVERIRVSGLSASQQGIAEALLLGWRDDVDAATQQQFRDAGITHLLCVSGLHVGIVAWLVGAGLFFLGMRRWQRVVKGVVQIGFVWLFVLMTGMAPSTLRAGVMFSLLIVGGMLQRQPNSLNNLCTSMLVLLVANPMWLFDVGFQLSFAAVAGILVWNRPLQRLVPLLSGPQPRWYLWLPQKVWQLVCLSTSAQLATLPLVLYHFHQFPLYFLVANITVVPFAGLLLGTVLAMLVTGGMPWLGGVATGLLRWELVGVDRLTRWIASLPHAMVTDIYCDLPIALVLTALILVLTLLLYSRKATV
ncbi:MAG: ComEC family competence protein [Bacteroidales bacterium]|nr:ComEC family competence protein [Bacteroidales bacterium]